MGKGTISCQNLWVDDDKIIIAMWDYDRIYEYDLINKETNSITCYTPRDKHKHAPYGDIYKYRENKYIFSPLAASEIVLYDSDVNKCRYISLKDCKEKVWLESIVPYDKYLYLIPGNYGAIVRFDCETEKIEYIDKCILDLKKRYGEQNNEIFRHGYALLGEDLYLASLCYRGIILKINLLSYEYEIIDMKEKGSFTSICGEENKCWLATSEGSILEWIPKENRYREYADTAEAFAGGNAYFDILKFSNYVIALPWNSKNITVIDVNSNETVKIDLDKTIDSDAMCLCGKIFEDCLYTYSFTLKKLFKISIPKFEIIEEIILYEANNDNVEFWEGFAENVFHERNSLSLKEYISYIKKIDKE